MGTFATGHQQPPPVVQQPFDVDPATGLGGGSGVDSGLSDTAVGLAIRKAVTFAVEKAASVVIKVGLISSSVGQGIIISDAAQGEEAAILLMYERDALVRAGLARMRGGVMQDMATSDP